MPVSGIPLQRILRHCSRLSEVAFINILLILRHIILEAAPQALLKVTCKNMRS